VPLTKIQTDILRLLASQRDPESYIAGATPLNRNGLRYSSDIDIFHDREARVSAAARSDATTLESKGYGLLWLRQQPAVYTAEIRRNDEATRLDWVADSDFRFFPVMRDDVFGYVLHPVDLALNKIMAAAGRRELRDIVDLVTAHETILPLGAAIWAATEKAPGFTPEGLIAEIRRNAQYPAAEWRALATSEPLNPQNIMERLHKALKDAEAFVARMPTEKMGLLFLDGDKVAQPDPDRLGKYQPHAGQRRGHWPDSPEIAAAMLERYKGR
jgi:hypothetical protein